jgi:N-acetylglucosamine kinase-like BadF-type ATPase
MMDISRLVLAVDGGQSSTLALLATTSGQVVGSGLAGPSNHIHEPGGMVRLENALRQSMERALEDAGQTRDAIVSVCLGMTGAPHAADEMIRKWLPAAHVQSYYDTVTALAGASCAQPGVVVIAGTGAVAYGRLSDGREAKAGGWGYIMGDEGSGYDIGRSALQAATQASDGRGMLTRLMRAVPEYFGVGSLYDVHEAVYSGKISRPEIARIAVVVAATAQEGDVVARRLLESAGGHLAEAARAVIERLDGANRALPVYPTGGVFKISEIVLQTLREALAAGAPSAQIHEAAFPPAVGALLLALEGAGTTLDERIFATIRSTLPQAATSKYDMQDT